MEPNVTASQSEAKPDPFADLAQELHTIAADLTDLIGSGLPKPRVSLHFQPGIYSDSEGDHTAAVVDSLGLVLAGRPGELQKMGDGAYHYNIGDFMRGPITVAVFRSVPTEWAVKREAVVALAAKEAELEKLRAEVAELRSGLGFSREADDPTPVSPARVPLHEGAFVDGDELVDETPVPELAYIAPTADGGVVWAMRTKPQCPPECLALDKDFSGYGVKVHLVSCPVGHAEAQR